MNKQFGGFPGDYEDDDDDPSLPSGTPDDDGVVRLNRPKAKVPKAQKKRAIKATRKVKPRRRNGGPNQ